MNGFPPWPDGVEREQSIDPQYSFQNTDVPSQTNTSQSLVAKKPVVWLTDQNTLAVEISHFFR